MRKRDNIIIFLFNSNSDACYNGTKRDVTFSRRYLLSVGTFSERRSFALIFLFANFCCNLVEP